MVPRTVKKIRFPAYWLHYPLNYMLTAGNGYRGTPNIPSKTGKNAYPNMVSHCFLPFTHNKYAVTSLMFENSDATVKKMSLERYNGKKYVL